MTHSLSCVPLAIVYRGRGGELMAVNIDSYNPWTMTFSPDRSATVIFHDSLMAYRFYLGRALKALDRREGGGS